MQCTNSPTTYRVASTILAVILALTLSATAQTEKILYTFSGGKDGSNPWSGLTFDSKGNLYGTTAYGGASCGVAYKLTPSTSGGWTQSVIHSFSDVDGCIPIGNLAIDGKGNLYGTASGGSGECGAGCVYELSPLASGKWKLSVLYNFFSGWIDGSLPTSGVIVDSAGNLYGITNGGGQEYCNALNVNCGTVFELSPGTGPFWHETVLHVFVGGKTDGGGPFGGLVFDPSGNLYGTTSYGGTNGEGTVFKLSLVKGAWQETLLYSFQFSASKPDGANPTGGLALDTTGNLYGTTVNGGAQNLGTIFKLTHSGTKWTERVLYSFLTALDAQPQANVVFDASGNLFGTSSGGQCDQSCGATWKLTVAGGHQTYNVLHYFGGTGDGATPYTSVNLDKAGNAFGTTFNCTPGAKCYGIAYELTP